MLRTPEAIVSIVIKQFQEVKEESSSHTDRVPEYFSTARFCGRAGIASGEYLAFAPRHINSFHEQIMLTGLCDSIARKAPLGAIEISAGMSRRKRLTGSISIISLSLNRFSLIPPHSLFELRSCNHHPDIHSSKLSTLQ